MDARVEGQCLNCGRSDEQVPLVSLRFDGKSLSICPQCLPILIHRPEQLSGKLGGVPMTGAPHDDQE